jgi:multiple sugar transport system ATP-binding protein
MATVSFRNVWKAFGDQHVVSDLSLDVVDGEFLVLVGPSGCGKTTTLRMLAGLETPTHGSIWIGDRDVTLAHPGERDISMVFQSYALYPHMTVFKNLAFGPSIRKESKSETKKQVEDVAEILGIAQYLHRKPNELSGGQRQRVALGRVMLRQPQVSLLDEPLSNLDAALRVQMRAELVKLQRRLGVTTVYVTHDQVEAMTMGDRIAVLDKGKLIQVDTPTNLYRRPANLTVGTFIGSPKMNIVPGTVSNTETALSAKFLDVSVEMNGLEIACTSNERQLDVFVGLRPHDLFWVEEAPAQCTGRLKAKVEIVEPTGSETFALVSIGDCSLTVRFSPDAEVESGSTILLAFDPHNVHLFHSETGESILVSRKSEIKVNSPLVEANSQTTK